MYTKWDSTQREKYITVLIIYLAFFLDNMLLTVVVPIIPDFLHATSLKLIPKSAFHDNIENLWPNTEALQSTTESSTTEYQSKNISLKTKDHKGIPKVLSKFPQKSNQTIVRDADFEARLLKNKELMSMQDNDEIESENGPVGVLLSSKALVQLFLNPVVGIWASKVGYKVPIFFGSVNLLLASLLFAYGESYLSMLVARSVQGVCSACIGVAGMCLAAETFRGGGNSVDGTDERARARALGALMGGGALGVLAGYPMGSLLYDFVGKQAPFFLIAACVCVTLVLQVAFFDFSPPAKVIEKTTGTVWLPLLSDSVVIVSTGAIFVSTSAMAILEPCLPIWLMTHLKPEKWQVGTVFIPDSLGYLLGTNLFGAVACRVGQWRVSVVALITIGVAAFIIPSAVSLGELLLPHFVLGLGIGALDAALVPLLAALVDSRHAACYEAAFSLQQTAVSLAYSVAPLAGGALARNVGFAWTLRGVGLLNALYSPLLAAIAWQFTSAIQSTRLLDSQSSDCEGLNQAINMATYGSTFD